MEEAWKGICYDDGTGRNVLYVDVKGQVINPYLSCTTDELFLIGVHSRFYSDNASNQTISCLNYSQLAKGDTIIEVIILCVRITSQRNRCVVMAYVLYRFLHSMQDYITVSISVQKQ